MFPTIRVPPRVEIAVALEPAYNGLNSLHGLKVADQLEGLHPWIVRTAAALPEEVHRTNQLLFGGLGLEALVNVVPRRAARTFLSFVDQLADQDPTRLRDGLFDWFLRSPQRRLFVDAPEPVTPPAAALLAEFPAYRDYVSGWSKEEVPEAWLARLHNLLNDPPRLQTTLVNHLRYMWTHCLRDEWTRIEPLLVETVDLFAGVAFGDSNVYEALQLVTGRDLRPLFKPELLWTYRRVRFIPAVHNGPYINWFADEDELRIVFNARRPAGLSQPTSTVLDQRELLERLKALADEVRLQILQLARQRGEVTSAEIIDTFALSSSAASRQLRQLVATGLLEERRAGGALKVYRPVPRTLRETLSQLDRDLG